MAASVLLLSSCGLSFVPPAPAVGNTCVQRTYWTPQCATSAPQGEKGGGVAGHRLMLPAVFRHCLPYWPTYTAPSHVYTLGSHIHPPLAHNPAADSRCQNWNVSFSGAGAGVARVGRLWAARREVDMDRGGMMQVLRSSNNEDEVLRAVEALEKGGALTLKDYTTLLAALKRIKQWKVRAMSYEA